MIDNFSIGVTHALMMLAAWRLLFRPDLDSEVDLPEAEIAPPKQQGWGKPRA